MVRSNPNGNSNHFVRAAEKSLPTVPSYSDNYYLKNVLQWLATAGTLRKEFEKNKLGNIRLRAVPIQR